MKILKILLAALMVVSLNSRADDEDDFADDALDEPMSAPEVTAPKDSAPTPEPGAGASEINSAAEGLEQAPAETPQKSAYNKKPEVKSKKKDDKGKKAKKDKKPKKDKKKDKKKAKAKGKKKLK